MSENKKGVAVAYLRAQGDGVEDALLRLQEACETCASSSGLTLQAVRPDVANGSTDAHREGLAAVLDGARGQKFGIVVVENCDRKARNTTDLSAIFASLEACGVEIHQVERDSLQPGDVSPSSFWQVERREANRGRIRFGQELSARRGLVPYSCCYGYATVPGKPGQRVIVAEQAKVVREIFDMRSGGASIVRIAAVLNARAVDDGRTWTEESVGRMLRNSLYAGTLVYGRRTTLRDRATGRIRMVARPRHEWTVVSVEHLRIVSQEAWDAVQALLAPRPDQRHRSGRSAMSRA